jgi:resuscitation-promoting factor RpfB
LPVKGGYLLAAGGGAILLWSGIKGHRWSAVLRDIIGGKQVPTTQELAIESSPSAFSSDGSGGGSITGSGGPVGGTKAKNLAIGRTLAIAYGWGAGAQWNALVALWTQESGWDNHAKNPTSGAYGIPQALPPSKMGALANPPVSSASAQIAWGLKYIKTNPNYGSPVAAEAHERSAGWY